MKKFILWLTVLINLGLSVYFGTMTYLEFKPYQINKKEIVKLKKNVVREYKSETDEDNDTDDFLKRKIDFKNLSEINPDIIAWIYIPETNIDYPILQGDQYLERNYKMESSKLGSIFTHKNAKMSNARTILFGHNMRQGQMFGELKKFNDIEFRSTHNNIYVYTNNSASVYRIFSIFIADENDDLFYQDIVSYHDNYDTIVYNLIKKNMYKDVEVLGIDDKQILSLITCYGSAGTDKRLIISAYKV